jgi:hypothetical protein
MAKHKHSGKHVTHGHKAYGSEGHIDAHVSTQGAGKDKMQDHMHGKHNKSHGLPHDAFGHDGASYAMHAGHHDGHESEVSEGGGKHGSMADNCCYEGEANEGYSSRRAALPEDEGSMDD